MSNLPKVLVSRREMVRGLVSVRSLFAVAVGMMMGLGGGAADAQASFRVGQGSAALGMRVQSVVGYRMMLREVAAPRIVAQQNGVVEYEIEVLAASNAQWRLSMVAPADAESNARRVYEVRNLRGEWIALEDASPYVVLNAQEPCNPRPVVIRYRIRQDRAESVSAAPRVSISVDAS